MAVSSLQVSGGFGNIYFELLMKNPCPFFRPLHRYQFQDMLSTTPLSSVYLNEYTTLHSLMVIMELEQPHSAANPTLSTINVN